MPVKFVIILYNSGAVLNEPRTKPTVHNGIGHAVLIATSESLHNKQRRMVLEFSASMGVRVNATAHTYKGNGWFMSEDNQWSGVVLQEGVFHESITLDMLEAKACDGKWTPESYGHDIKHNCLGFVNDLIEWGLNPHANSDDDDEDNSERVVVPKRQKWDTQCNLFTTRFHVKSEADKDTAEQADNETESWGSNNSSPSEQQKRKQSAVSSSRFNFSHSVNHSSARSLSSTKSSEHEDRATEDLLNSAFYAMPTMHLKQQLIGLIFKHSGMSISEIHARLPSVCESTIKLGLQQVVKDGHGTLEIETKQHGTHRERMFDWERDTFKDKMMPFFTQPLSGSKENKKGQSLWRTEFKPLELWTKYLKILPKMVDQAKACNVSRSAKSKYGHLTLTPRSFGFFKEKLLKLIHYTEETNARRCHYCEDYATAQSEERALLESANTMEPAQYAIELAALATRLSIGAKHTERWYRQNGYIVNLRANPLPGQALVQTDYFSFYSVTGKINVLALVLSYQNNDGT